VIVIAGGGGGIPVVSDENGQVHGTEAVIDKDHAAALLGLIIGAEILLILTDVPKVALRYGRPNQLDLDRMTTAEALTFMSEGHFAPGSMEPKIEAAIEFLIGGGERVIITRPELADAAINGTAGTTIVL
jgi:carbamate kinase